MLGTTNVEGQFFMFDRILVAKLAWGSRYEGEQLVGFSYKGAHGENFNFKSFDGQVYGLIPRVSPKVHKKQHGWLVLFLAREHGNGPLRPIGWYENATFEKGPHPAHPVS